MKKRAVLYLRVSTEDQVKRTSLDSQADICRKYCAREGVEVAKVFREEGESAKTTDRPQLKQAMLYCATPKNRVGYLVVYKSDRLSRHHDGYRDLRAKLLRYGVKIRSATEPIADDPAGEFLEIMLSGMAQFDNAVRAERTKEGMRRTAMAGGWIYRAPLGYKLTRNASNLPILIEDEATASLVRRVFELVAKQCLNETQAWKEAVRMGLTQPGGRPLHRQTVHKMLRQQAYCGRIQNAATGGQVVQAAFEPLVAPEIYDRAQLVLAGKGHASTKHVQQNPSFPLRGTVTCGTCGSTLTASYSSGRSQKYPYYRCTAAAGAKM